MSARMLTSSDRGILDGRPGCECPPGHEHSAELRKGSRAHANVRSWYAALDAEDILVSVVTVGEIRKGIERVRRRDLAVARALEPWLRRVLVDYRVRILSVDLSVAAEWAA